MVNDNKELKRMVNDNKELKSLGEKSYLHINPVTSIDTDKADNNSNNSTSDLSLPLIIKKDTIVYRTPLKKVLLKSQDKENIECNVYLCRNYILPEILDRLQRNINSNSFIDIESASKCIADDVESLCKSLSHCNVHAEEYKDKKLIKQSLAHYLCALIEKSKCYQVKNASVHLNRTHYCLF